MFALLHPSRRRQILSGRRRSARRAAQTLAVTAIALAASPLSVAAQERDLSAPLDFQGRMLVSVSDADMVASAYVNGQLGPREGQDALSVIALAGDPRD